MAAEGGAQARAEAGAAVHVHHGAARCLLSLYEAAAEGLAEWAEFDAEAELERLRAARPHLRSRISRAENILVTHLSCRRANIIRVRCSHSLGSRRVFLVRGSGGAVYVVDPEGWGCSCPDAHRRGKGCEHSIACWALWRATVSRGRHRPGRRGAGRPDRSHRETRDGARDNTYGRRYPTAPGPGGTVAPGALRGVHCDPERLDRTARRLGV